jgi:N-acyl-D-aspartate/D-glutamate deacylase
VATEPNRAHEGRNILEASSGEGKGPYEFMRDLLVEESGRVGMITFGMSEDHLKRLMAHPKIGIGADGSAQAPYGPLSKGRPHPRSYGSFARALGKYVREDGVVPLEEMIRKMTSMPAAHLGFARRGLIKEGWAADLAVFDPDRIIDRATFADPMRYPEGIAGVIVNGAVVVERADHTGLLPGRVLRKTATGAVA